MADSQGDWSDSLGPFHAGGPYELKISGSDTIVIRDGSGRISVLCSNEFRPRAAA